MSHSQVDESQLETIEMSSNNDNKNKGRSYLMSSAFDTQFENKSEMPAKQMGSQGMGTDQSTTRVTMQGNQGFSTIGSQPQNTKDSDDRFGQPPVFMPPPKPQQPGQQAGGLGDMKPSPVMSDFGTNGQASKPINQFPVQPSMVVSNVPMPTNGRHTRSFPNGSVYSGDFKDGKRHGQGRQQWADGAVYEGAWVDDKIHGQGQLTHGNGDVFAGNFVNNSAQGQGKYIRFEGGEYMGEWANDRQHGKGLEVSPDGDRYEGTFKAGKKDGTGFYQWSNGCKYEGQWSNNRINGEVDS